MNPFQIIYIVWFYILPFLGILASILVPIVWFFIVPARARGMTYERFSNVSYHFVCDDSGHCWLRPTKEELPEGVIRTKKGYRFLPRWAWKKVMGEGESSNPGTEEGLPLAHDILHRKFIWGDMGKPIWFDYAGLVTSTNPSTLAALQQSKAPWQLDVELVFKELIEYVKDKLPKEPRKDLVKIIEQVKAGIQAKPLTPLDPSKIKEDFPKMYTPSQVQFVATHSELLGMKKRGGEYGKLILGGAIIMALLILGIVVIFTMD